MLELLTDPQAWLALATLTILEIVLGVDNVIFIAILSGKLPEGQQKRARTIGLVLAMLMRIALLFSLTWVMRLTTPLFSVLEHSVSGRDLLLVGGGLFLLGKATLEIHDKLEGEDVETGGPAAVSFASIIAQVVLLDAVFSLDAVITAIGLADHIAIMVIAVLISVAFMLIFVEHISRFVERHPTVKILALSFLLLIGFTLVGEGLGLHIPKGYVYFAMAFSAFVEALNLRMRKPARPVHLRRRTVGAR